MAINERGRHVGYTDEQLVTAVQRSSSFREVLIQLSLVAAGGNYEVVRRRVHRLGLDISHFRTRRHAVPLQALTAAVAEAVSFASALRQLGVEPTPAATRWLQRQILAADLDTSHFTGQAWRRHRTFPSRVPLEQYLQRGRVVNTNALRRRLLRDGVFPPRCAVCALGDWNGQSISLELDHINGDRTDNRLDNLRVLCPNCHAQTSTWRGRNIGCGERRGGVE